MDDLALLRDFVAGDRNAFRELMARHHDAVLQVARYYASEHYEDVAQETWLAVCREADKFQGRSSFKTWLLTICSNRARSMGYHESKYLSIDLQEAVSADRFSDGGAWLAPPAPFSEILADQDERAAVLRVIHVAIEELRDPTRAVVMLRDVEGLDTREVAEVLQLTEANVRVLLHRGRAHIRNAVEEWRGGVN